MKKYITPEIEIRRFHIDTFLCSGTGGNEGGDGPDAAMYGDVNSYMQDDEEEELRYLLDL